MECCRFICKSKISSFSLFLDRLLSFSIVFFIDSFDTMCDGLLALSVGVGVSSLFTLELYLMFFRNVLIICVDGIELFV